MAPYIFLSVSSEKVIMCRKQISLILILIFAFNFAQTQYKTESNISYYPEKISRTDSYIEVQDLTKK